MELDKAIGWDEGSLESLLEYYIGGDWGKDPEHQDDGMELAYCIRGSEIKNWAEDKGKTASLRKIKKTNIIKRQLTEGDILVEISGGGPEQPVGRTILIDKATLSFEPKVPKICTNFLRLIRPKKTIDSKYLNSYLQLFYSSGEIVNFQNGSNNLRNLKFPEFLKITIPFPLLNKQQLIVEKIEELFSELDKGIENLKTALLQLKVYRQAVLKWAFEGKLTITDKIWKDVKLEQVANAIDPQPSHRTPPKFSGGIPYISIKDFDSELDTIDFTGARIVSPDVLKEHQARYKLETGDFVIGKIGTIGKPVRLTLPQNYALSANIVLIQPRKINSTFLYYFFQSNQIEKEFTDGKSATSQAAFGIKKVRELNIKLPSDKEQLQVVQEVESRLSVCDKIEETITNSLQQSEALRQSILKKAFEGKLVETGIKSVYKPKNTYFYQMQLLGVIAAASKEKGINHGEMTIAKYAYLLDKVYHIPTYYDYKRWHLGPYPPEIKKAINNAKFFTKKNNSIEVKDIDTLTKYTNPYNDKLKDAVDDLSDMFSKYTGKDRSHQIELLATVCKVIEDIQSTDLNNIRASMTEWKIDLSTTHFKSKAEKFSEGETDKCLKLINNKGWHLKLLRNE